MVTSVEGVQVVLSKSRDQEYAELATGEALDLAWRAGSVIRGRLEVSKVDMEVATVTTSKGTDDTGNRVFILGRDAINRAVHGDEVGVQLLPRAQWAAPNMHQQLLHDSADRDNKSSVAAAKPATEASATGAVPTGTNEPALDAS